MIHSGRSERGADHERPEVIEAGFGTLAGSDYRAIVHGVRSLTAGDVPRLLHRPNPLGRGDSGASIAEFLVKKQAIELVA
jgi:UDP-N-acetylglucosamine 2-epimerase